MRFETAEPPGTRVRVVGFSDAVIPLGERTVKETLPPNPAELDTLTLAVTDDLAGSVFDPGLVTMEKSGGLTVMVWEVTPTVPRESVAAMWTMYVPGA